MITLWSNNYIPSKPIERAMQAFGASFDKDNRVLDIGCGHMPYKKFFNCQYFGLDPMPEVHPDIVGDAWNIPVEDSSFDGLILNQALEHIADTDNTIKEIRRVLKPGGRCIITVPQSMKNHSHAQLFSNAPVKIDTEQEFPYWQVDYYRFTKYGLLYLFRDFKIISLKESNGYFGSLFQFINYFIASTPLQPFAAPFYLLNNLVGTTVDGIFEEIGHWPFQVTKKFQEYLQSSLTINYILIIEKKS